MERESKQPQIANLVDERGFEPALLVANGVEKFIRRGAATTYVF
jgi:hypothetical protein